MASEGSEAATQRLAELEEAAEQLSRCQADKEFGWYLWNHLQVSKPDLTQAVSLVVKREKQKAEVKNRRILEILQAKGSKIESLERRLTGPQQEINRLMQRKTAVDEQNVRLKNEFSNLNQKFKDKSELKDTEECAQKKEEQNRVVIKNLEEENKGLNICCADLLSDLEKLRKQKAQKKEKSGNNARIENLETDLAKTRGEIKSFHSTCSNLSSQVDVKQEELFQKDCDMVGAKKELEELQNPHRQNIEDTTQQAELIKQLEGLNADKQEVLQDQEYTHTAKTTYQKLLVSVRTPLTMEFYEFPLISALQEKIEKADLNPAKHNLYTTYTPESDNIRTGRKHEQRLSSSYLCATVKPRPSALSPQTFSLITRKEPPVKRSRSLSPKSSFREAEELKKLKIAERKIENLEKTLQLKSHESYELAAYGKHEERLQMLQTNYRALKEQLKQWEEGDSRLENSKSRYQHTGFCQLCQEDPDVMWNELPFFKREHKKLLIEKLNPEEELDQIKIHLSVKPLFKLGEDDEVKGNTPKRYMREVSHEMLQKYIQLERRSKAIEGELKKQKEVNKNLLNEKIYLKESLKVQKEDADTQKRELELLKRICEVQKEKSELQLVIDEKEKEAASLNRQVTEANRLRNESEDLLSQVQEQKCLLDKAKAVAISGQYNCKITGTKVRLNKKKSSLGHHGAFLKQSIKVMSNVFENFSKDGWEDVSESSDSEIPTSESLETVFMKTLQNIDPLSDKSKQEEKKPYLEVQNDQYSKEGQNKIINHIIYYDFFPCKHAILYSVNRAKGRNITVQKPGYSVTLLQEKIKSLQQTAVLQSKNKTAVASIKNVKERNEKLTNQLHLADQRLQVNKLTIEVLTSSLAKWQQEKEDLQGKLKLREHLSQTAGKSEATPAPSKNIDLEVKQLQCKLKNSNTEITKQSTTIKSLRKQVEEREEWIRELQVWSLFYPLCLLERDLTMKRHLIENIRSRLKSNQENEKTSNILENLERKVKGLAEDEKASIDSRKQRFNVATKEKSQYEQMYHKIKDDLEKKDLKLAKLESKTTECAMTKLETAASQQLHGLAKQSTQALETLQKELLFTSDKVEEFKIFVKTLTGELHHNIEELRTKIKVAKMEEMKACKKGLSQESLQLATSILNVSTTDLYEILQEGDDEETAKTKPEFQKDKEWLQHIQKLLEAQFPFASYFLDAIPKLNEKKKLVEEYSSLMKHTL
ncbi:LOW QUALITY PROTEIN: centlein [Sylvia borin]